MGRGQPPESVSKWPFLAPKGPGPPGQSQPRLLVVTGPLVVPGLSVCFPAPAETPSGVINHPHLSSLAPNKSSGNQLPSAVPHP